MKSNKDVYIIAEAGVNHNGSIETAKKLIDVAKDCGASAIKFQTYKTEKIVVRDAQKADYQIRNTNTADESQFQMLKKLELSYDDFTELHNYCKTKSIDFMSSPFDLESLDFLTDKLRLNNIKIGSGEITNGPLLLSLARKKVNIIFSTGMSYLNEIEEAIKLIAFGFKYETGYPTQEKTAEAFGDSRVLEQLKERISVLHCTSEYPAPYDEINLKVMEQLSQLYGVQIGYSDHTKGIHIPIAAVALGAKIIEKHITLDKSMEGPDHLASIDPKELKEMVSGIRQVEQALGQNTKTVTMAEKSNRLIARKSIVACKPISKGAVFTEDLLTSMRPGDGRSPMEIWNLIGSVAECDYKEGEKI